ncbi:MAG TPA: hypothetical protein VFB50_00995 [Chloroflexota bacterium]|nr:hypothetical protein [Chloroflexota bacterium]
MTDGRLDYVFYDLDRVRDAQLIEDALDLGRVRINVDRTTSFTWVTLRELVDAGAVLDIDVELPARLAMRTPAWYEEKCDTWNRAHWRGLITEAEATAELEFWHRVCWQLPWPQGWRIGRIRDASDLSDAEG